MKYRIEDVESREQMLPAVLDENGDVVSGPFQCCTVGLGKLPYYEGSEPEPVVTVIPDNGDEPYHFFLEVR